MFYVLTDSQFVGDVNQSRGVVNALGLPAEGVQYIEETEFDLGCLRAGDQVLVAGDHGLWKAKEIQEQKKKDVQVIWTGHQFFDAFLEIFPEEWPDIIALPQSVCEQPTPKDRFDPMPLGKQLLPTVGVAHNVNKTSVEEAASTFSFEPPISDDAFVVGITLAGDAPSPHGHVKFFTPEDAARQAELIYEHMRKKHPEIFGDKNPVKLELLIMNGPRTGKYDPKTGELVSPDPHRSEAADPVSVAFLSTLETLFPWANRRFFHFQYGKKSPYLPLMNYCVNANKALWVVPAESTSMVTESSYLANNGVEVLVYRPSSMNESHEAVVDEAIKNGLVSDVGSEVSQLPQVVAPKLSAAEVIAAAIAAEVMPPSAVPPQVILSRRKLSVFKIHASAPAPQGDASVPQGDAPAASALNFE